VSPAFDAYVEWSTQQLQPAIAQHGLALVCWAFANGHLRRLRADGSIEVEVWNAEDQVRQRALIELTSGKVLPTGTGGHDAFTGLVASHAYQTLRQRALAEMRDDRLFIDLEAGPEIWSRSQDPALRQRARELAERV